MSSRVASPNDARSGRITRSSTARARALDVAAPRIAQRVCRSASIELVDRVGGTEIDAARRAVLAHDVGRVVRRPVRFGVPLGLRIERAEDRELQQRRVGGHRRLHRFERDRLHLRAELGAVLAQLAFELLLPRFEILDRVGRARRPRDPSGALKREPRQFGGRRLQLVQQRRSRGLGDPLPHRPRSVSVIASSTRPLRCSRTSAASAPASGLSGASLRCSEIVRSVRSDTLPTKASFCRSDPTARLSASCVSRIASARR